MQIVSILGIRFYAFDSTEEFKNEITKFFVGDKCISIFTPNAEMIARATEDENFRGILMRSEINLPDGVGVLLLSKKMGFNIKRFPGIEAMLEILTLAETLKVPVYFLGAKKEVVESMVDRLKLRYPNLVIAGYRDGYFKEEEEDSIIEEVNNSGAGILFVALGFPKQEIFIDRYKNRLNVKIAMGVGGSFDVLSGKKKRAPEIIRKLNLEWLYRILQDPKRILNRVPNLIKFIKFYFKYEYYEKNN
ncbi:MAG: WecB/TagA/CpsF family glycosyltransferase [Dictyoglomus thermophilum]|uniref:Glycosyltransferase n=1 Tax=Dictyoglomus thermophilum TaxID=14 RepID=A0A7C3PRR1_DICTH|nr:WecB/TagA/CpsF family glycosyltransferase [Dictyoglomus thermophilum]MCX7719961.1 WecB/TagA/CpsF family glycosyltransferase [Dictyoglomus thermophilum]TYT22594.1 WecB/TagA/CpsF family glycosyltransferase [Dictyoglomus thermophilum]